MKLPLRALLKKKKPGNLGGMKRMQLILIIWAGHPGMCEESILDTFQFEEKLSQQSSKLKLQTRSTALRLYRRLLHPNWPEVTTWGFPSAREEMGNSA